MQVEIRNLNQTMMRVDAVWRLGGRPSTARAAARPALVFVRLRRPVGLALHLPLPGLHQPGLLVVVLQEREDRVRRDAVAQQLQNRAARCEPGRAGWKVEISVRRTRERAPRRMTAFIRLK